MWTLSQHWYGDRLDRSYTPKTITALQQFLVKVGLTSDFWQLQR
ncbi:MAG TPA: hypothetical protein VIH06_13275 [Ilumatobacteraceae bacterium]